MRLLPPVRGHASALFLCAGLTAAVAFVLCQGHPAAQGLLYVGMSVAQTVAVGYGVRRGRPACPAGWWSLAAGVTVFSVANVIWYGYPVLLHGTLPFPSVADALFFTAYTCTAAGLVLLIRSRSSRGDRLGALVDSAIITVTAGFVVWLHVLGPTAALSHGTGPQRVVALGYPLFDLALAALVARMMFTAGARSPAFWLVCGFVTTQLVTDGGYAVSILNGTFGYGQSLNIGWIVSYALVGAAALHPSMRTLGLVSRDAAERTAPMLRLAIVSGAALLVPVLGLTIEHAGDRLLHTTTLALFVLCLARMAILVRELHRKATVLEGRERELSATVRRLNESEDDLAHQASHDSLTGLPNRAWFLHRLRRAVERGTPVAVMLLDLDGFKTVNDSLGHAAGDTMLIEVATRLKSALRGTDCVARLGGDEFTILAEGAGAEGAVELAGRVLAALDAPVVLDSRPVFCQASVGIALSADGSCPAVELLRDADAAMYTAKRRGGRRYEVFSADMHARALDRLALECDLRGAVPGVDMTLHYQPLMDLGSGQLAGFEALLRWHHPERGLVPPDVFIPIAEETGAIIAIGRWVLHAACRQVREWQRAYAGSGSLGISVNVSARQLADPAMVADVASALAATGLRPELLTLEITETMIMADEDAVRECLYGLKRLGVRISVDDFGTGYSSLGHLDRFPIDELKIDRSFVAGLGAPGEGASVAAAAIRLARSLHIDVVAEGVEREDQLTELRKFACTRGQGYLFSRPLPAAGAAELLRDPALTQLAPAAAPVVLVIDDDRAVRRSTCAVLRRAGFRTAEAATGRAALAAAGAVAYDAFVLDVGLPDIDGYEVAARLAATGAGVPLVYLSGSAVESGDRARGLDAGAGCYLVKPASPEELVAAVRAVIRAQGLGLAPSAA
jgi:diguanylate cyclase (GGDEF)-like protein